MTIRAIRIEAVSVNHNTSLYAELMLRSLYAHHSLGEMPKSSSHSRTNTCTRDDL